ncbi:MAG TPA: hypothetical protein ENF80_02880 [Thermofilum sp.]|nr:hypothetical protein [Thermofilum sp.]
MQISSRYILSKRGRRRIIEDASKGLSEEVAELVKEASMVEVAKVRSKDIEIVIVDKKPLFFTVKNDVFPLLIGVVKYNVRLSLPIVVVDEGAVPHVLNGADVMVPGIVEIRGIMDKGKKVYVSDLKGRIFAVGKALMSADEVRSSSKGRAVKNVHYAGDWLWELSLKL